MVLEVREFLAVIRRKGVERKGQQVEQTNDHLSDQACILTRHLGQEA
jgi:hypothetical protein